MPPEGRAPFSLITSVAAPRGDAKQFEDSGGLVVGCIDYPAAIRADIAKRLSPGGRGTFSLVPADAGPRSGRCTALSRLGYPDRPEKPLVNCPG